MTIKIYGTEASRAMRPIWTAEEMGLEYELEMMPFAPRVFQPEYFTLEPVHGDFIKMYKYDCICLKV